MNPGTSDNDNSNDQQHEGPPAEVIMRLDSVTEGQESKHTARQNETANGQPTKDPVASAADTTTSSALGIPGFKPADFYHPEAEMDIDTEDDSSSPDTITFGSELEDLSNAILGRPRSLSAQAPQHPISLREFASNNKSSSDLSLPHTDMNREVENTEASLQHNEQSLGDNPGQILSAEAMQSEALGQAFVNQSMGQHHLRMARNKIMRNKSNKKAIVVPPYPSSSGIYYIYEGRRHFGPGTDPKEQLMGLLYGDENWTSQRLLEETGGVPINLSDAIQTEETGGVPIDMSDAIQTEETTSRSRGRGYAVSRPWGLQRRDSVHGGARRRGQIEDEDEVGSIADEM